MSDWARLGEQDHDAGQPREYGSIRTAPVRWGRRRALSDYRHGWDMAALRSGEREVERLRALVDAPIIGRTVRALEGADYDTRRETALGLLTQAQASPDNPDMQAMYAGAVASVVAASGVDTTSEVWMRTRELFDGPDADISPGDSRGSADRWEKIDRSAS